MLPLQVELLVLLGYVPWSFLSWVLTGTVWCLGTLKAGHRREIFSGVKLEPPDGGCTELKDVLPRAGLDVDAFFIGSW